MVHINNKTEVANIHKIIKKNNQNKKSLDVEDSQAKILNFLQIMKTCYFGDGTFKGDVQNVLGENSVLVKPPVSANPPF